MKTIKILSTVCLMGITLASCGNKGAKKEMYQPAIVEQTRPAPEWVYKGSAAFPNEPKTVFYGVGVVNSMPNIALMRETADARARANIASEMKTAVAKLVRDYMDMHVDYFNQDAAGSDEFITYVAKLTTDAILINCRIIDHWQDPKTGAYYSLAKMDASEDFYQQYKEAMKKALRDAHLASVIKKRDEAEKTLDAEIEKQRARESQILGK